jgi:hypothetical protein
MDERPRERECNDFDSFLPGNPHGRWRAAEVEDPFVGYGPSTVGGVALHILVIALLAGGL